MDFFARVSAISAGDMGAHALSIFLGDEPNGIKMENLGRSMPPEADVQGILDLIEDVLGPEQVPAILLSADFSALALALQELR